MSGPAAPTTPALAGELAPPVRDGLVALLQAMADDELVIGFMESEWTGIAPLLEEDVAMSSLAQDELGHAAALYGLLGQITGRDPDAIAYDRPVTEFRHARLLDHPRGDWATTIARRYLYDTADAARLDVLADSSWSPLATLLAKIRREETYHLLHAETWLERLAQHPGEPRHRLTIAWTALSPDAGSVLCPVAGEANLIADGVLPLAMASIREKWLERIAPTLDRLGLPVPRTVGDADLVDARSGSRSDAFRWLYSEMTAVRRLDPSATW